MSAAATTAAVADQALKARDPVPIEPDALLDAEIASNDLNFQYATAEQKVARTLRAYPIVVYIGCWSRNGGKPLCALNLNGTTSFGHIARMICADPELEGGTERQLTPPLQPNEVRLTYAGGGMDHSRCLCSHSGLQAGSTIYYSLKPRPQQQRTAAATASTATATAAAKK